MNVFFVGIDLAGSERRKTGICILDDENIEIKEVEKNGEIFTVFSKIKERMDSAGKDIWVGIDAPLSLPKGRISIDRRQGIHFRSCDLELRKLGIKFFPITLGPMRMLTKRGMMLKNKLEKMGIRVFEVFPGATYDIFGVPRKSKKEILMLFGKLLPAKVKLPLRKYSQDELDAIACAITVKLFYDGKAKEIGDKAEGTIIIPKRNITLTGQNPKPKSE